MEVQASSRLPSAMRQDLKFDVDRALFPFESKFVDSRGGARIHYVDEGQGPVVLMLHGNPTWSFLYRKMIARMSGHFWQDDQGEAAADHIMDWAKRRGWIG